MCGENDSEGTATGTVLIENARTRVTEWRFARKGDDTGWHLHEYDYIVVPLSDGQLELHEPGQESMRAELHKGSPYFRKKGIRHNVVNANETEFIFIEIEFLER